jgi:hypothetical protein
VWPEEENDNLTKDKLRNRFPTKLVARKSESRDSTSAPSFGRLCHLVDNRQETQHECLYNRRQKNKQQKSIILANSTHRMEADAFSSPPALDMD